MPKRKIKSKNQNHLKKTKNDDGNSIAEIFIKEHKEASSSSDDSSDESDTSSSDDSYYRKKRTTKKRKKKLNSGKKIYRRLIDQIDLFQRNVDIKLNYLESLIQTLIKNQNQTALASPDQSATHSKKLPKRPSRNLSNQETQSPGTSIVPTLTVKILKPEVVQPKVRTIRDSINPGKTIDIPRFPISNIEHMFEFDQQLTKNDEYRKTLAQILSSRATYGKHATQQSRVKTLIYYAFDLELLTDFTWTGFSNRAVGGKKNALRSYIGIIALLRSTINYGIPEEEKISDRELMDGIKDALKRAPEKHKVYHKHYPGPIFPLDNIADDDDDVTQTEQIFKEELPYTVEAEDQDMSIQALEDIY